VYQASITSGSLDQGSKFTSDNQAQELESSARPAALIEAISVVTRASAGVATALKFKQVKAAAVIQAKAGDDMAAAR
jgi:hypothetical protein